MKPLLIKGGRVIDPSQNMDRRADVLLADGRVAALEENLDLPPAGEEIDASGLVVAPGLIDIHVHLRDPGQVHKEDIISGACAAAAGGFTAVVAMPNTDPVVDEPAVVRYVLDRAGGALVRVYPVAAITRGLKGKEMAELGLMKAAGAVAFSDDGKPVYNSVFMRNALQYSSGIGATLIVHEEDPYLFEGGVMHEGAVSSLLGLRGIPAAAEEVMIARDLTLLRDFGGRLHIAHLSTAGGVELVRRARAEGLPVSAEVTPHHLLLTDRIVRDSGYSTDTKVNPPIRSEEDRQALWAGLLDGTIDAVASDHAPHHPDEKDVEYDFAPFGLAGLEITLPLLLDEIASGRHRDLTLPLLVEKLSTGPARVLNLPGGTLRPGSPGDVTLIDPERVIQVEPEKWYSRSRNTPFGGRRLKGGPLYTIVGGKIVMKEGVPAVLPG